MKPAPFHYHRPRALEEALAVLAELGESGKVLAGGQSLVPLMSMRLASPEHVVDLNHVPGLDTVEVAGGAVCVSALARHAAVEADREVRSALPLLGEALAQVAHPAIRNRGTTVGSLVHGDPAAEIPAVLSLLAGSVRLVSVRGTREVAADDFFIGPLETAIAPDEIAVGARFPVPPTGAGTAFLEVSRRHGDYALCGVAALVVPPSAGRAATARAALLNVGPRPVVVDLTAAAGATGSDRDGVREAVDSAIEPEADIHATADYRRHLAHVLTRRALDRARDRSRAASGGGP